MRFFQENMSVVYEKQKERQVIILRGKELSPARRGECMKTDEGVLKFFKC